jgi:hypothetical protein
VSLTALSNWLCRKSTRIRIYILKGVNPWIRGSDGIVRWKNHRTKISWHGPFKSMNLSCNYYLYNAWNNLTPNYLVCSTFLLLFHSQKKLSWEQVGTEFRYDDPWEGVSSCTQVTTRRNGKENKKAMEMKMIASWKESFNPRCYGLRLNLLWTNVHFLRIKKKTEFHYQKKIIAISYMLFFIERSIIQQVMLGLMLFSNLKVHENLWDSFVHAER